MRAQSQKGMDKLVGFFKTLSWLLFLGALLWSYAYLPTQVVYRMNSSADAVIEKGTFFFGSLAFFLVINIVCIIFLRTLKKVKSSEEGRGLQNKALKKDLTMWVKGFIGILNFFFTLIVVFVAYMNGAQEFQTSYLGGFVYIGPALLLIWFFYLAGLLAKKRN